MKWTHRKKIIYKSVIFVVICLLVCSCSHKSGHNRDKNKDGKEINKTNTLTEVEPILTANEIFEMCNTAVFMIVGSNTQASGFFVTSDGLAISNYHVINNLYSKNDIIVLSNGDRYSIKEIVKYSEYYDYAIFTTTCRNTNYLSISDKQFKVGDKVYAIGSPYGLQNTFSSGEISQIRNKYIIQTTAQVDYGASGGALINEHGEVIGITSAITDNSTANLNFAISLEVIDR